MQELLQSHQEKEDSADSDDHAKKPVPKGRKRDRNATYTAICQRDYRSKIKKEELEKKMKNMENAQSEFNRTLLGSLVFRDKATRGKAISEEGILRIATMRGTMSDYQIRAALGQSVVGRASISRIRYRMAACIRTVSQFKVRPAIAKLLPPAVESIPPDLQVGGGNEGWRSRAGIIAAVDGLTEKPSIFGLAYKSDGTPDKSVVKAKVGDEVVSLKECDCFSQVCHRARVCFRLASV